ncbi:hypothetical protein RRG08_018836 [Elysia crispata]|uniref:Uncharacterized protein n=1 Tax=Elysia crispata TaxID=231223 RepID=A0AAE0YBV2_9GAST|nr:hypothetical protein RRG08_018836 [Elysia crispata]
MKITIAAVLLLLVSQALCDQICQAPQSETVFLRTGILEDLYMAQDFTQGKILITFSDSAQDENWAIVDLNENRTYIHINNVCQFVAYSPGQNKFGYDLFDQCLPADAKLERSGDVDFYYMTRPGFDWLVGMKPVPSTEYYFMHFSRFASVGVDGVAIVAVEDTFGVVYKYSLGISDPTIFNKDLSACTDVIMWQNSTLTWRLSGYYWYLECHPTAQLRQTMKPTDGRYNPIASRGAVSPHRDIRTAVLTPQPLDLSRLTV